MFEIWNKSFRKTTTWDNILKFLLVVYLWILFLFIWFTTLVLKPPLWEVQPESLFRGKRDWYTGLQLFLFKYRKRREYFFLNTCLKGLETLDLATYKNVCLFEKSLPLLPGSFVVPEWWAKSLPGFSRCVFILEYILASQNHSLLNQCVFNSYVVK